MKKLYSFIAIALLVMALAVPVFADANMTSTAGSSGMGELKSVTSINTDAVGYDSTDFSTAQHPAVVAGKCQIVGYQCNAIAVNSVEALFSLVDVTSTTPQTMDGDHRIIAEAEATNTLPFNEMLPQGLGVTQGLTVRQGPKTSVTVWYRQVRP